MINDIKFHSQTSQENYVMPKETYKPPTLYFSPISLELPLLINPQPSPFFPSDQMFSDYEHDLNINDKDDFIHQKKNEERFTRHARENSGSSVDYYNKWIMENMG